MSVEAIVIQAGQGEALSLRGTQVAYKAEGQRPAGGPTFLEFTAAPGFNTGDHIHSQIEEIFYVVEGEFQIRAGDRVLRAKPGDFVLVPPGVPASAARRLSASGVADVLPSRPRLRRRTTGCPRPPAGWRPGR